jgi:hypothetical protein
VKHAPPRAATELLDLLPLDGTAELAQVRHAMADLDAELEDRVARWCAEAGRQAGAAQVRRALAPLGWDDLLAVRALLADPPPARPLGPFALADIARGTPPDLAAEREREGRYRAEEDRAEDDRDPGEDEAPRPPPAPPAPSRRKAAGRKARRQEVVIHRARDRAAAPAPPAAAPELPRVEDLRRPEGRTVLERLIRDLGARRAAVAHALAAGWTRDDGAPPGEEDVASLLEHHGLARAFARRERDELIHTLRATRGFREAAAERLALDAAGLDAALERAGAAQEASRIREERRKELRALRTLAERIRLLLGEEPRLRDLGLLEEFEADLRARLPEHVRALRLGAGPLAGAFARSLSLEGAAASRVAARFGLDLGDARRDGGRPPTRDRRRTGGADRRPRGSSARRSGGGAPPATRPGGEAPPARRSGGGAPPARRSGGGAPPARRSGGGAPPARRSGGAPPASRSGGGTPPARRAGGRAGDRPQAGPRRGRPPKR